MGIPVITNVGVGDVEEIVTKYDAGYIINDFTERSFSNVIEKISAGRVFDKDKIRDGAREFYALETAVERYRKVYSKILE